jgi:predicted ferric reductase
MTNLLANEQLWWYVARSGGIVALLLTGSSVLFGLVMSTRIMKGASSPQWLNGTHRWWGGLSVTFTGVHVLALALDSFVSFGVLDILVPFASSWKPGAVAWGIVTMYLLLAVQITSMLGKRIPRTWWKRVHATSFLLFWTGLVHGATAGTDASQPAYIVATAALTLLTVFLSAYRVLTKRRTPSPKTATASVVG